MQNFSPATLDLGLGAGLGDGAVLNAQLKTDEETRKKKLLAASRTTPSLYGDSVMGLAALDLLGGGRG